MFEGDRLFTSCLDRQSGRILRRRAVDRQRSEELDPRNDPASPSPAVDEAGNVYVFLGEFGLVSYDPDGVERWRLPLGPFDNLYGMGTSPIIARDLVILACATPRRSSTSLRTDRCRCWWPGPSR